MQEAYVQGRHRDVSILYRGLAHLKEQEREEVQSKGGRICPILPVEMAMCLSGPILPELTMEQTIKSFFDSYPHDEEIGACLIVEEWGQKWWEPIAAELGKGRERGEEWQALWTLYQEAKKRKILEGLPREGEQGDREGGNDDLRAYVLKVLSQAAAAAKGEQTRSLRSLNSPSERQVRDELILTLASPLAPEAVLQLEMVGEEGGNHQQYKYTPQDFHKAIDFLSRGGLDDEGVALLRRMTERGLTPLPETYGQLISRLFWRKHRRSAQYLFEEMRERGGTDHQDLDSYVMAQGSRADGYGGSLQALKRLTLLTESYGLKPLATAYRNVLRGLAEGRRGREAYQLLQEMKKRGVTPDGWAYSQAIEACARTGNMHQQMLKLFREISDEDKSVLIYQYALEALATAGQCQEALELVGDMRVKGIAPDAGCFNLIMKVHRNAGQLEEALALLRQMKRDGVQPDVFTYTTAIDVCARRADWELAIKLLREMEEDGIAPNVFTYGCVINVCAKAAQGKRAVTLLREMQEKGVRPNEKVYSATINALHRSQDDATALVEIYEEMEAKGVKGVKPLASNCVAAIKAYAHIGGMPDKIVEIGCKLIAVDDSANSFFTLKTLLSAAVQAKKYKDGMHFFNQALIHDIGLGDSTKLAATCAAEVGDLTTLQIYLEYVLQAEGRVEDWMPTLAFKAVDRAKAEADDKNRKTGKGLGEKEAEAIQKLRSLALRMRKKAADLRRREGKVKKRI